MTVAELLEHGLSSAALADGCWSLPQALPQRRQLADRQAVSS